MLGSNECECVREVLFSFVQRKRDGRRGNSSMSFVSGKNFLLGCEMVVEWGRGT